MKRLAIIVLIFLFLIFIVAFIVSRQKTIPTPTILPPQSNLPSINSLPLLSGSPYDNTPQGIQFVVSFISPNIPDRLPIYSYDPNGWSPKQAAQTIAIHNGITTSPKQLETNSGTLFLWSSPVISITAKESEKNLSYSNSAIVTNPNFSLTQNSADTIVRQFLKDNGLDFLNPNISIESSSIVSAQGQEGANATSEDKFFLRYRIVVDNKFPIFSQITAPPIISVAVGKSGTLRTLSLSFVGALGPKIEDRMLLPLNQAEDALNQGKGVLISYSTKNLQERSSSPVFSQVSLTSVAVGYLPFEKERIFRPVYLFTGTTNTPTGSSIAQYMLPATN